MTVMLRPLLLAIQLVYLPQPLVSTRPLFGRRSEVLNQMNHYKIIGQLQQRILRGMNRTEPPQIKITETPKPDVQVNKTRLILVTSHAPDFRRQDVVSFQLDSCVFSHVLDIEKASLVFRLRSIQTEPQPVMKNRRSGSVTRNIKKRRLVKKHSQLRKRLKRCKTKPDSTRGPIMGVLVKNYPSEVSSDCANSDSTYNQTTESLQGHRMPYDDSGVAHLKIVVRAMNTTTDRKRNIAVEEIEVKSVVSVLVPVPTKYLRRAALAKDHTLTLQVVCRRCRQRAWIESVYTHERPRRQKKNIKQNRRRILNPSRPYLYIDMRNSTCADQSGKNFAFSGIQGKAISFKTEVF